MLYYLNLILIEKNTFYACSRRDPDTTGKLSLGYYFMNLHILQGDNVTLNAQCQGVSSAHTLPISTF